MNLEYKFIYIIIKQLFCILYNMDSTGSTPSEKAEKPKSKIPLDKHKYFPSIKE